MFSIIERLATRVAAGIGAALIASGCGGGRSPVPSAPSATATPPVIPSGPYTITGVVVDEGGRPVAGATIDACCISGMSYSHWHVNNPLLSDESGHFQMTGTPATARLWFRVGKEGFVQQCATAPVTVDGDLSVEIALMSVANLTASAESRPGFRSVSGTVVEITASGKQPVARANVWWNAFEDFDVAWTYTDQNGRFALCGLPADEAVYLGAYVRGSGPWGNTSVPPGQTTDVEIVLR